MSHFTLRVGPHTNLELEGKTGSTSGDMPNKKRRYVLHALTFRALQIDPQRSDSAMSVFEATVPDTSKPILAGENGIPPINLTPILEIPGHTFNMAQKLASGVDAHEDLKSPQLPYGENVNVATGPQAAVGI